MEKSRVDRWKAILRSGDVPTVTALIKEGLDPNTLIDDFTLLDLAAMFGNTNAVRALLDVGADVNAPSGPNGETALIAAARGGCAALVQLLIDRGADVHFCCRIHGNALASAVMSGDSRSHEEVVEVLLAAGADPQRTAEGRLILAAAARNTRVRKVVPLLLSHGASPDEIDTVWNATPLHLAVDAGNDAAVVAMLEAGADPLVIAPECRAEWSGLSSLEFARRKKRKKIVEILENRKPRTPSVTATESAVQKNTQSRRVGSKTACSVREGWSQLERVLKSDAEEVFGSLRKGATEKQIEAFETKTGLKLSRDVRDIFACHNGQTETRPLTLPKTDEGTGCHLLSLADAAREWGIMADLLAGGDFDDLKATTDEGIRNVWWSEKWLPIAADGPGNLICLDLGPAKGGKKGQIICFYHEHGRRERLADSPGVWLRQLAEQIQTS